MSLIIQVVIMLVVIVIFAVVGCRIAAKTEVRCREEAPTDIRPATEEEKQFFKQFYHMPGRRIDSQRYISELEQMSRDLKVAEGYITERHEGGATDYTACSFDIIIKDKEYDCVLLTVGNGKNTDYRESVSVNTPVLGFFTPDENGVYKSITFATVENVENKS